MLGHDQDGDDAFVAEIGQELVHVEDQGLLSGHRGNVAVEAVDDDDAGPRRDFAPDLAHELAGRQGSRGKLGPDEPFGLPRAVEVEAETARALGGCPVTLVEREDGGPSAVLDRRERILDRERRLADARRTDQQSAGAPPQAPSKERVECRDAAGLRFSWEIRAVVGCNQARIYFQAPGSDHIVMIAAAEVHAAQLDDREPPANSAIFHAAGLETEDAVHNAVE